MFTVDANEIFRGVMVFATATILLARVIMMIGRRRMFGLQWREDIRLNILHKVTPQRGAAKHLLRRVVFYLVVIIVVAFGGLLLSQLTALFSSFWFRAIGVLYLWPVMFSAVNFAALKLFPHSELARRLVFAISQDPKLPNLNFSSTQTGVNTVVVYHATPTPEETWKERKKFLAACGNLDIHDIAEIKHGEVEFTLSLAKRLTIRAGQVTERADGSLLIAKESSSSVSEVYFFYNKNFISDDGKRTGQIKIGRGNSMARLNDGETWIVDLQVLGHFPETDDFNEDTIHDKFKHLRICKNPKKRSGKELFYDDKSIRDFIDKKRMEMTK